ncbi:unnamed protein product [Polarella glacialis]|uniref:Fe2OG dioxygenase domain-containing protein n=1 Tax=Polarella glacialis TaxID=89957 RepID=A0A813JK13_POLGL|nr:unnamed protein product [Polarella glacialis]CAE8612995.1 unnamed protein product [Polarella glacialis]CAE8679353.1 unnamed protein product [Polarella glacialis]|mmetsp:Transcript_8652/g.13725  ORF Transcript_8652/g.13725 Transcript_8652/m.13725 type:complete len:314 (+) Transcript_8652:74-1015(+)
MGKKRLQTTASTEAVRIAVDKEGGIAQGPGNEGNVFDVHMQAETDGLVASQKIVDVLKDRGVCLCEANAPHDLLSQAFEEAETLWQAGEFGPPMQVFDQDSQFEAQLWQEVLYKDEPKVLWMSEEASSSSRKMDSLKLLSQNMLDFAKGLGDTLAQETGISFTHTWNAMLSCYSGSKSYELHVDNPHACSDRGLPDNGLRMTLCYYINPHWDPDSGSNGGGLDVFLTDPRIAPSSAAAARKSKKLRIAPHADTLAIFLSERMGHQVVETTGRERWFCLTMWCFDQLAMSDFVPKVSQVQQQALAADRSDDDYD